MRRSSETPEDSRDLAEDLDVVGVDRLEKLVLGLEANTAGLAVERLHRRLVGRLVVARERDHDLAVASLLGTLDDEDVAVEDAGVDHGLALDPEQEVGAAAERLRDRELV